METIRAYTVEIALGAVLVAIIGVVVWGLFQPTCADRGGTSVFSHFQPIVHKVGEVTWVQQVPIYDCIGVR